MASPYAALEKMRKPPTSRFIPGTMRLNEERLPKPVLAFDPGTDTIAVRTDDKVRTSRILEDTLPMFDVDHLVFKRRRDDLQVTEAFIGERHVATIYGLKKRKLKSEFPVMRFGNFVIEFHNVPIPEVEGSDFWASHYNGAKDMIRTTLSIIPE